MSDAGAEPLEFARLKAIFHGVAGLPTSVECTVEVVDSQHDLPSYLVKLLLLIMKFPWWKSLEKSAWQVYVRYEGFNFEIRDWKRSSWSVGVDSAEPAAAIAGRRLIQKIIAAARLLDSLLAPAFSTQVSAGEFFLQNSYPKIRRAYEHFKERAQTAAETVQHDSDPRVDWLMKPLAAIRASELSWALNGYAAAGFYYAGLEVLFDAMYAFGPRIVAFPEFKQMKWRERFLHVLPLAGDAALSDLYSRLLRTKRDFRDPVLHGLGGDDALLVEGPAGVGLIPISYESLSRSMSFSTLEGDSERAKIAFAIFDAFDEWVAGNPAAQFALEFLTSGFVIPFSADDVNPVNAAMTTIDEFRSWLSEQAALEDDRGEQW